ncbi:3-oxoacyl-[acyl-carrier-protein] synthase III C-terminal domain-containing protein [Streptomyces sp. M19]
MADGTARTALVANVQNTAGQVFAQPDVRTLSHAPIPGDGCGVAYLEAGGPPAARRAHPQHPAVRPRPGPGHPDKRKYWEPGTGQMDIHFDETKTTEILQRGNSLVPELVRSCARTWTCPPRHRRARHQPAQPHLPQELAGGPRPRRAAPPGHLRPAGNLYGAAVPITLDHAARTGQLSEGDLVVMSGFAHAGDFASAAAIRWHGAA